MLNAAVIQFITSNLKPGYVTDRDILWGPMAAVGVTAMIPIIIFTLIIQKHLVRGLTYGAVK